MHLNVTTPHPTWEKHQQTAKGMDAGVCDSRSQRRIQRREHGQREHGQLLQRLNKRAKTGAPLGLYLSATPLTI